jgi:hypothetical protein
MHSPSQNLNLLQTLHFATLLNLLLILKLAILAD